MFLICKCRPQNIDRKQYLHFYLSTTSLTHLTERPVQRVDSIRCLSLFNWFLIKGFLFGSTGFYFDQLVFVCINQCSFYFMDQPVFHRLYQFILYLMDQPVLSDLDQTVSPPCFFGSTGKSEVRSELEILLMTNKTRARHKRTRYR